MKEFDNLQQLGDFPAELIEKNPSLATFLPPKADSKEDDMKMPEGMNLPPNIEEMMKNMGGGQGMPGLDGKGMDEKDCCIF